MEKLAGKGRRGGNGVLVQIAREVVGRRRSVQGAIGEVRHPAVLDALSDDDFRTLDELIDERISSDREFAQVLARLTHAAAHAKGFDRQTVDAALRLDGLLPAEDPAREREKLLKDAYRAAQRIGYVQGGRRALARLGQRAASTGDSERARLLLQQQVDLGPASLDTEDEVESAIMLGDILRRDGDVQGGLDLFERAGDSAERLDFQQGSAESLIRQIDVRRAQLGSDDLLGMQERVLDAATASGDVAIQSRIVVNYADTLVQAGRLDDAMECLERGLQLSREIGDLTLENQCLAMLSEVERELGHLNTLAQHQEELLESDQSLGRAPVAADDAVQHGSTLLSLGRAEAARDAFERAVALARESQDELLEQRAYGGLGVSYSQMNQPVEALNHLMLALDLARSNGDPAQEAQWLGSIGEALWKFGQADDAIQAINSAITSARTADDLDLQAGMYALLGQIAQADRKMPKAAGHYEHALRLYREIGKPEEEISMLSALGAIAADVDQVDDAIGLYEDALQLAARTDQRAAAVRIYGRLARLSQRHGDTEAALEALNQAVDLADTIDQPALLNQALQHLAVAQDAAGDPAAMETYEQALVLSRELGDIHGESMMLVNVGARLLASGARRDGVAILEHAITLVDGAGPAGDGLRRRAEHLLLQARTGQETPANGSSQTLRRRMSRAPRLENPASRNADQAQTTAAANLASMSASHQGQASASPR